MLLLVTGESFGFTGRLLGNGLGLRELLLRDRTGLYFFNLLLLRMGSQDLAHLEVWVTQGLGK